MRFASAVRVAICTLALGTAACSSESGSGPVPSADAGPAVDVDARLAAATTPAQRRAVEAQRSEGGGERREVVSADAVSQRFEAAAGVPLKREQTTAAYSALALPLADAAGDPMPDADRLAERWGSFTIYVARDGRRLAERGGLGDLVPTTMPDRRGVVWAEEKDVVGDRYQVAYKFYADGAVMLSWLGGDGKRTGPSFVRLDRLLRSLEPR